MKRIVLLITALLVWVSAEAQQYDTHLQEFNFVYIGHDTDTPIQETMERLDYLYEEAVNHRDEYAVVFYLPNGYDPIIVRINTPNSNEDDYEIIKRELIMNRMHYVDPEVDVQKITELFNEVDIIDEEGNPLYKNVMWTYYINPSFWQMYYNERVIAYLYWVLEMEPLVESRYLMLNVLIGKDSVDAVEYDPQLPFGPKDMCKAYKFSLMPY